MADQQFLASLGVDIDESGVSRLLFRYIYPDSITKYLKTNVNYQSRSRSSGGIYIGVPSVTEG